MAEAEAKALRVRMESLEAQSRMRPAPDAFSAAGGQRDQEPRATAKVDERLCKVSASHSRRTPEF